MTEQPGPQPTRAVLTRNSLWHFSEGSGPALRVGILLDSTQLARCHVSVLQDIKASNFARLELAVIMGPSERRQARNPRTSIGSILYPDVLRHALYSLYLRYDRRVSLENDPLKRIDCSEQISHVEKIEFNASDLSFSENTQLIKAKDLDVLINFSSSNNVTDIAKAARFGVWSYRYADPEFFRGGPSQFWEMYEGSPVSGVVLEALHDPAQQPLQLCKSIFATGTSLKVSANRFAPYWGSSELVIRKLNELHRFGWDYITQNALNTPRYQGKRQRYGIPGNLDMARWSGPILLKKAASYRSRRPRVPHWRMAIRIGSKPLFEVDPNQKIDVSGFRWIDSPKGYFWADPFAFEAQGKTWVFFEEYSYQAKRAWLSCAEIRSDGSLGSPVRCLDNPGRHHSYPYIFRDGPEIYMVPEAYDSGSVDLYRCEDFPTRWVKVCNYLRGQFVDTSLWNQNGLWWMMTTNADPSPLTTCLLLFYSESLAGPWRVHPGNPISADVRNNRGAGRIFQTERRWIRPSQSCAPIYGYSFSLNEILELSPTRYAERPLVTVNPELWKDLRAVHTYNWERNVELIDGLKLLPAVEVK